MRNYRRHHKLSRFKPIIRSAFEWSSFGNRSDSLKLLRRDRVHVDTILATQDGFTDLIHWQAILALSPSLLKASEVSEKAIESNNETAGQIGKTTAKTLRHIELPRCVDSNLAKKLIACAYGEQVELDRIRLVDFYRLAEKFKIDYAITVCLNQGKNLLDIRNCIQLLMLSLKHRHHTLRRTSYSFLRSNFKLVISLNKDFHLLPCEYLKRLLQDDYLKLDEDEEFAWIAILRWLREKPLSEREITDIHNQMTGRVNYSSGESFGSWLSNERQQQQIRIGTQPRASNSLSMQRATVQPFGWPMLQILLSPHFRFDSTSWNQNMDPVQKQTSTNSLVMWTESDRADLWNDRIVDENQLIELVKCLRFLRFRSLDALNLIASCNFVQRSEKLSLLVFNMELRYLIRKRLPIDRQQLEQLIGRETLANIERCESNSATKTMLKKLKDLLSIRPPLEPQQMGLATYKSTIELRSEARKKLAEKLTQQELDEVNQQCLQRSDRPRIPNSVALLVGGWQDGAVCKTMMAYDFICDKWFKLSIRLPEPRAFHVACCSPENSQLFIMGGTNGVEILNSVLRFDPSSDVLAAHPTGITRNSRKTTKKPENGDKVAKQLVYKFHRIKSMRERRCHLSGVYHSDGRLYALGGHNGNQRLRSGEWYSSKSDQWHDIADMTIARSDASACSHENKIFIAGGQIGDQFIQSSVEFYKPSDNTWTFAAPMIVPRMSFQLVSHRSMLLALGGTIGLMHGDQAASMTRSVEKYNSQLESWSVCAPMSQKRSSFGAFSVDGKLIVAGGHGGSKRLKTCEQLSILNFPEPQQYQHHRRGPTRTLSESDMQNVAHRQQVRPQHQQQQRQEEQRRSPGDPVERPQMLSAASESRINQMFGLRNGSVTLKTAMRWVGKAELPAKRSGFSVCVVQQMNNAKDFTYHGSIRGNKANRVTAVKQKSRWHRFKIIRRRKLIKHAKIALVLTVIILLM